MIFLIERGLNGSRFFLFTLPRLSGLWHPLVAFIGWWKVAGLGLELFCSLETQREDERCGKFCVLVDLRFCSKYLPFG